MEMQRFEIYKNIISRSRKFRKLYKYTFLLNINLDYDIKFNR